MQEAFIRADQHFSELVDAVTPDQWKRISITTPEWTIHRLVGHVTENNRAVCKAFGEDDSLTASMDDDPAATWEEAASQAESVVESIDDLNEDVKTPMGKMSAEDYLTMMMTDRLVHSYDLAVAIGADTRLDPELVEIAYKFVAPKADAMREKGLFGPAVTVPDDASAQHKLLAITGRNPRA